MSDKHIRPVDQSMLDVLREHAEGATVPDLTKSLGVTATAVRQRLDRLVEQGLVDRQKKVEGRGRPQYSYQLTVTGLREVSASYADLAAALWNEVLEISNPRIRRQLLERVAKRLGTQLLPSVQHTASTDLNEKLTLAAQELASKKLDVSLEQSDDNLPVLELQTCPYPELVSESTGRGSRELCELEQSMLSNALGHEVELDQCVLDGHRCCQFKPIETGSQETTNPTSDPKDD